MASAVFWGLTTSGFRPVWLRSASFADSVIGPVSLQSSGHGPWEANDGLDRSRYASVLYRWAEPRKGLPNVQVCDSTFVSKEWELFGNNVYALSDQLSDALWVNPPAAAERTENKLVQLHEAARCGLRHPATLVSNDPERIRRFIRRNGRTVYKPFKPHTWENGERGDLFHTATTLLDPAMKLDDEVLRICPGIYQAYVDKSSDLRITVIGDRFFPVRISSRAKREFVDWRSHWRDEDFVSSPCKLPATYEDQLSALMKRLNIVYGAIDLAVDQQGELYFLEVNQVGQFLFVESWLDSMPLLQAMCAMLAEGRTDYSLSTCPNVHYKDYLTSDEHQRWKETELPGITEDTSWRSREGRTPGAESSEPPVGSAQLVRRKESNCGI